jgi:hypothetical protein
VARAADRCDAGQYPEPAASRGNFKAVGAR